MGATVPLRRINARLERPIEDRKGTEAALLEGEQPFRTLVETMGEGLGIQDVDGRLVYVIPQDFRDHGL